MQLLRNRGLVGLTNYEIMEVFGDYNLDCDNVKDFEPMERIESEDLGYDLDVEPFNPNLIRIRREVLSLSQLVDMMENEEINFQTSFQRNSGLWDDVKQSRLIESLILRLPLPFFYFDEISINDSNFENQKILWEVIDGLQRCTSFKEFILKQSFCLKGLEFLKTLEGKTFSELPREMQRRINQSQLSIIVVEEGTPDAVKFNIFKRINTAGLVLSPQEIRHAMFQGIGADTIAELAGEPAFLSATMNSIPTNRMEDRDFVTRFVSFYLQDYSSYQPDFDTFLTNGMKELSKMPQTGREHLRIAFIESMDLSRDLLGERAFRRRPQSSRKRMPINKPLFEVISTCLARLTNEERSILRLSKETFLMYYNTLEDNPVFVRSISAGTGQRQSVLNRFKEMEQVILNTIRHHAF